ncbi:MAG: hypothetical protein AAF404_06845 [Pseudomonadota bacterium]
MTMVCAQAFSSAWHNASGIGFAPGAFIGFAQRFIVVIVDA